MQLGFDVVAAKSKKDDGQDAPTQVRMAPQGVGRRNPTTDQKKVRRQQAKTAAIGDHADGYCPSCGSEDLTSIEGGQGAQVACGECDWEGDEYDANPANQTKESKVAFTEGVDCPGSGEHVEGDFGGEKGGITGNPQNEKGTCPSCGQQVSVSGEGYLHTHLLPGKTKEERTGAKTAAARDLKVGDVISAGTDYSVGYSPTGKQSGTVSKVDTTTTPGSVYVWFEGSSGEPPADLIFNHGDPVKTTTAARSDYDHWNEDADMMWWQEEGRHPEEPPEIDDFDIDDRDYEDEEEDEDMDAYATLSAKEADLLRRMQHAPLDEQRKMAVTLTNLRQAKAQAVQDARDVDLADAVVRDHLTPVLTHALNTTATDWIGDEPDLDVPEHEAGTFQAMVAEASLWFDRTSAEVKADRSEFAEQAIGMARAHAGRYASRAPQAQRAFLDHVAFLYKRAEGIEPLPDSAPGQQAPNVEPWPGEQHTTGDSPDLEVLPSVASNLDDAFIFEAADADITSYPAHEQAGYGESGLPDEPTPGDEEPFDAKQEGWVEPDQGAEVPSTRAPVIQENASRMAAEEKCSHCGGSGWIDGTTTERCPTCDGTGKAKTARRVTAARPLYEIAADIRADWKNVYFGAVPYLEAMGDLNSINDSYGADDGRMIVAYFLSNTRGWTGEKAKALKAELKALQKGGALASDNGNADSSLKDREVGNPDDRPMWPWELPEGDVETGDDAADVAGVHTPGQSVADYPQPKSSSVTANEGQTCSVCGDKIAHDPSGETPSTWHHDNGEKHDHEATPGGGATASHKQAFKVGDKVVFVEHPVLSGDMVGKTGTITEVIEESGTGWSPSDTAHEVKVAIDGGGGEDWFWGDMAKGARRRTQAGGLENLGDDKAKPFTTEDDDEEDKTAAFRRRVRAGLVASRGRRPFGDRTAAEEVICPYCDFVGTNEKVRDHITAEGPEHQENGTVSDQVNSRIAAAPVIVPDNVGARDMDPKELARQIGGMNIASISGGRINVINKGGKPCGISLPVAQGYVVNVFLANDDTYTVQRVFRGAVKAEQTNVYMDEVGEVAYRAGMYHHDWGSHVRGSKTADVRDDIRRFTDERRDAKTTFERWKGHPTGGGNYSSVPTKDVPILPNTPGVPQCSFCGAPKENLSYRQEAWSNETDCSRCGAISGYGIGD